VGPGLHGLPGRVRASQPAPKPAPFIRLCSASGNGGAFAFPPVRGTDRCRLGDDSNASLLDPDYHYCAMPDKHADDARLQCSTGPFWAFDLEEALDSIAAAGFGDIELMITRDPQTQEADIVKGLADARGLRISSIHGPFLVITRSVWGMESLGKVHRGVEMCRALGADTYIVHPPYLWEREFAGWIREESADYSAENGVTVAVETMYPKWVAGRRLRAYRWLEPAALAHAAPHVVMDTSHLAVTRADVLDAFEVLRPKLRHIHLSDNAGDGRDGHLEVGKGILPIDRLLGEMRRTQYDGAVSLELSVSRFIEDAEELEAMLRRSREYVTGRLVRPPRVDKGLPR
jgi:sugar phosphate isomerase/epimerase